MVSTFYDRIDHLQEAVGHGDLVLQLVIDQIYAHYQHESLDLDHPRGGEAEYARRELFAEYGRYMQRLAGALLTTDGSDLTKEAIDVVEDFCTGVAGRTPREFEDLMRSGHPIVTSDGATVYDRKPQVGRLSEQELREKDRARDRLGLRRGHKEHIPHEVKAALRDLRERRRRRNP